MGDVLRNSLSIMAMSNGFACQHYSCIPSNPENRIYSCNIRGCLCCHLAMKTKKKHAMFKNGHIRFDIMQSNMARMSLQSGFMGASNLLKVSNMVASVESGLVCEEEEDIQKIKGEFKPTFHDLKLPPWGDLEICPCPSSEPSRVSKPMASSKGMVTMRDNRIHFLEETDEEVLSKRILMLSRSNKIRSALELYWSMEFSGLRPNVHACNSLLSCLLRNEMLDDALKVFGVMKANEITTGHSYSLILKAVANARGSDSALKLFVELEGNDKLKEDFDAIVYNTMISVCGKVNNWFESEKIWKSMKESGQIGTVVTYHLLVSIFVRCKQNELALDAYNEMIQTGFKPGADAMQAIIGVCSKEGKWDLALNVFENMLNSRLKPSSITCNVLINSLGKAREVGLALRVYRLMKSLGHTPDAYTLAALLGTLYRSNRHMYALRLFECIKKEQSSLLNLHLYNTALMSCQKLRLWDKALQLLWQMEAAGMQVSTTSYNLVIGACENARKPKVALQVYEHMVHQNCTPDTFTHLSLIRGCIWGSLWAEVEEILKVAPSASLYNAAIQGMCLRGKIDSARKLYAKMHQSCLKPDGKTRALVLQNFPKDSFGQCNRWHSSHNESSKLSSHCCKSLIKRFN